jgi:hypothetical protein
MDKSKCLLAKTGLNPDPAPLERCLHRQTPAREILEGRTLYGGFGRQTDRFRPFWAASAWSGKLPPDTIQSKEVRKAGILDSTGNVSAE